MEQFKLEFSIYWICKNNVKLNIHEGYTILIYLGNEFILLFNTPIMVLMLVTLCYIAFLF